MKEKVYFVIVMIIGLSLFFMYNQSVSIPEGIFPVPVKNEKTGKWEYKYKRHTVIEAKFDEAFEFSSNLARVKLSEKWGYIDKNGNEIIPVKYDFANNFTDGLALVGLAGKYGFIDTAGKEVIPIKYSSILNFSEDLLKVELEGKYGIINKTGKEVVLIKYEGIGTLSNGFASIKLDGKYGYINETGTIVIPVKYDSAGVFANGYANVSLGETSGKIDQTGIFTIQAMTIPLIEAVQKKYVRFSAYGGSISSSNIRIENVSDMQLNLVIPAGTFLSANSSAYQNMILTNPKNITIEAGSVYSGSVNTACMNMYRDIPDSNNSFGIAQRPNNHLLTKVIKILSEGNYSYSVIQAAVWIVTDNADYYDMGLLRNQFGGRTIDDDDYQKAVSVVNEARRM